MTKCLDNINVKGLEKWILSFCLFAFLPFHASAIDVKGKKNSAVVDGISYQLNAKKETAIVVKSPDIYSGDIVIPEKIEVDSLTFYVEEVAASAFEKATGVTSVAFIKKNALKSPSSVQYAISTLLDNQILTYEQEGRTKTYSLEDRFLEMWVRRWY